MKFFLLSLLFSFGIASSVATPTEVVNDPAPVAVEMITPSPEDEEGLFCRIRNDDGEVIASCVVCNCARLAEEARN